MAARTLVYQGPMIRKAPRIRTIKPDAFQDEDLSALPHQTRLFFMALWCWADRRGRLEYRPEYLKSQIFPYERADIAGMVGALSKKFIAKYSVDGKEYLWIRKFNEHQRPNPREADSVIPDPPTETTVNTVGKSRFARVGKGENLDRGEGEGELEGEGSIVHSAHATMQDFGTWWEAWPKKEGRGASEESWKRHVVGKAALTDLIDGIEKWHGSRKWAEGFIPLPATWLNQHRWQDDPTPASPFGKSVQQSLGGLQRFVDRGKEDPGDSAGS